MYSQKDEFLKNVQKLYMKNGDSSFLCVEASHCFCVFEIPDILGRTFTYIV